MKKIKILFFLSVIFSALVWITIVPIWHFPDEQAHFGQVAFIGETGRSPMGEENDLTQEIYTSEILLGTKRDNLGNNRFTFHPEYKIQYSDFLDGIYEASISALSKNSAGREFVYKEASRYPVLYYVPASIIYKLFYQVDLFTKVYLVRLYSITLFLLNILFIYKMGKNIFRENAFLVLSYSLLSGFMPMFVFANTGVNSDALGNLLFTAYLYLTLRIFKYGNNWKNIVFTLITVILCVYTKPQFIVTVPLFFLSLIIIFLRDYRGSHKYKILILGLIISSVTIDYLISKGTSAFVLLQSFAGDFNAGSFIKFFIEYTIPHTWKEVLPWFWGIYDWLGVTYTRGVHKVINRIIILSVLGLVISLIKQIVQIRKKARLDKTSQGIIFLLFVSMVYFAGIAYYDWVSWYKSGYQLGIQGRYYFPLISVLIYLLLTGWRGIFPEKYKLKTYATKLLGLLMMVLNIIGIYTIINTYYTVDSQIPIIYQISQYKPWFVKGYFLVGLFVIFLSVNILFLYRYLKMSNNKKN